jgi:sporulation protein YlmC with PRC-barrel domain
MIKGKSLLGRSIVGQDDGKVIGTVKDLVFDHDTNEVLALLLADKDLFGLIDAVIVPWRFVRNFGGDVILVDSAKALMKLHQTRAPKV